MLIPALDLIDGQVVRLYQGDFKQQTTYDADPVAVACRYRDAGAEVLHLVDLDGARDVTKRQLPLLKAITEATGLPIQTGGGIRTREDLVDLFDAGVQRAVIGSKAVQDPETVYAWLNEFGPEAIVLALDIMIDAEGQRWLATHGWQEKSSVTLDALMTGYRQRGLKHVLCTDISKDGTLQGPNVALYRDLKQAYPEIIWQASGGVAALHDLTELAAVQCDSVILGKALLTGQFTLQEALQCWQNA
ncbi:1-(5-phosphoribosyl)-5-[(5-phosphoribosylamino)methylideneamino]imidazole-4-carboxamide isomerase [Aliidiomarina sanyensis]|uniref:1-(5-phosphoribosyl)-5-[(5-phosphoribosylamino)methylideneamino] imidazole-4-carboxamide isomerase n=1 Tax=Aliidiomarina sanyensis TaxID=1249555 RepID=A0A432WNJ1_9GAMM|nr:1-(5-phosphoribosyl)-5-[(5-phosphoribosylamino)methylideneamino]imidazole-4-carboxamide isomerase [Aliidiomarina sanyensis]RUO35345.1 1-(5-phosphoribosyl)-5-[(5-phosphoribosylamino)methylideneamino]imidazole-4-carboxamide isomerase [Aliidiomarina sanyensis]